MKKLIALVLALSLLVSLAACGAAHAPAAQATETTAQTEAPVETEAPAETEAAPVAAYPMTLTDQAGREVTLAAKPERIVSGYYIASSTLVALGLTDSIVGREAKADKRALYRLAAPQLIDLPNVGSVKEMDLEACISAEPDLVVLPLKLKAAAESLEELDIPVLLVNPESEELLLEMVALLAKAGDVTERAEELYAFLGQQKDRLAQITGEKPAVYLAGNSDLLSTAGSKMYQSDLIALAGGENVAAELEDTYWAEISYEQLLAWDPEYIVLASDAGYTVEDVLNDANLASCRAVKEGKVVHLPNSVESWDSPLPASILGSVWLASVLHSEEMTAEEANDIITAFYSRFYGFAYEAA